MELVKLSEFVTGLHDVHPTIAKDAIKWTKTQIYTRFITQPLNLGMFVPAKEVDGKWEVLEDPEDPCKKNSYCIDFCQGKCQEEYNEELKEYQQAKENVLFDKIKISEHKELYLGDLNNEFVMFAVIEEENIYFMAKTIEDLAGFVKLTPNGIKQAGL